MYPKLYNWSLDILLMMQEKQTLKMRKLHKSIVEEIEKRSLLKEKDLHESDIGDVEKKIKVKLANPKKTPIVFEWELSEKFGWQFHDLEFISEEKYKKRERYVDSFLKDL